MNKFFKNIHTALKREEWEDEFPTLGLSFGVMMVLLTIIIVFTIIAIFGPGGLLILPILLAICRIMYAGVTGE